MKKIDDITYILKDGSIVNIYDDGYVELFPSKFWKKPKCLTKTGFGKCHSFFHQSKERATKIWNEINNLL